MPTGNEASTTEVNYPIGCFQNPATTRTSRAKVVQSQRMKIWNSKMTQILKTLMITKMQSRTTAMRMVCQART